MLFRALPEANAKGVYDGAEWRDRECSAVYTVIVNHFVYTAIEVGFCSTFVVLTAHCCRLPQLAACGAWHAGGIYVFFFKCHVLFE